MEACLTPSSSLPPGAESAESCHPCGGLWSPSLAQSPRIEAGSCPGNITRSLSWSLMAGTSCDVALELKASRMPCADFVTKPWHGHQCGFHHPSRLLAYSMLHLSLVPARSPSSPVPADYSLANSTDLSLTTGSLAGWQEQGPCLALPSDNLWSPSGRGILGLPYPGEGHGTVPAGMMAQCQWRREDLPALCCFLFLSSSYSVSPFPPTSSCHMLGQPGWGEAGGSGSCR